jgi:hypothetical protein
MLLALVGMAEFGRIFAIYTGLFNAAREGTRYGMVQPLDPTGIVATAEDKIFLVDPSDVTTTVTFDGGPGTAPKSLSYVTVGDRVNVRVYYDVEPMVPFLQPLMQNLYVESVASRTIASMGGGTYTPATVVPTPTFEPTPTLVYTPVPTLTVSVTPGVTPTPNIPIDITEPLRAGDTAVSGTAQPGQVLTLRDIQNPEVSHSVTVDPDGRFTFRLDAGLVAGHVIVVQGYGRTDWAIVQGVPTPTPTLLPTETPTPVPTPGNLDIRIEPRCAMAGTLDVVVNGYNWPNNNVYIFHIFGASEILVGQIAKQDFDIDFQATVTIDASNEGTHAIQASYKSGGTLVFGDSETLEVPCPATPTPTPTPPPSYPNLVVERFELVNSEPISTHLPITFTVSVRNIGETAANNLFWVDLYIDPSQELSPTNPLLEESTDWTAVSALEADAAITLTLYHPEGFTEVGDHAAYAMADTWNQILESDELDNLSSVLTVPVSVEGNPPGEEPTPTPAPVENGQVSGSTWLYINGDVVLQGRVNVYCYDGAQLIAETLSDQEGSFLLTDVPPGTYAIIGEAVINDVLYTDIAMDVVVESGQTTNYVTLILH